MKIVGPPGLRVGVGRQAADVPAVAHRQQRQHGDLRVLGGVQRAEQDARAGSRRSSSSPSSYHSACVVNECGGRSSAVEVDDLVVGQALALVGVDLLGDGHAAEAQRHAERLAAVEQALDLGVGLALGLRVPVAVEGRDERAARVEVELARPRRSAPGAGRSAPSWIVVGRARGLDRAEQLAAGDVDHRDAVGRGRAQRHARGRVVLGVAQQVLPAALDELALARRAGRRRPASAGRGSRRRPRSSGPSCAAHSRWARWIGSFSCQTIAASTGRSRNSSGWRQKNWSSASSPAT